MFSLVSGEMGSYCQLVVKLKIQFNKNWTLNTFKEI